MSERDAASSDDDDFMQEDNAQIDLTAPGATDMDVDEWSQRQLAYLGRVQAMLLGSTA